MLSRLRALSIFATCASLAVMTEGGCSSDATETAEAKCDVRVDAFKELIIVEPAVVNDARSKNATNGPWSFRHVIESMGDPTIPANVFLASWLRVWIDQTQHNGAALDREPRGSEMEHVVICPWLRSSPENGCDDQCGTCAKRDLDLAKAPFRLIAISNRMDLRKTEVFHRTPAGEARLVFALTDGPGDDPASLPRAFTVAFEYALPESKSIKEWSDGWHGLAKHPAFDAAYLAELEGITESFLARGKDPGRPNGSAISQVRTNESVLNWIWQFREFHLNTSGVLELASTQNTPLETINDTPILAKWVSENSEAIRKERYLVPESLLGGSANAFLFRWTVPGVDEETRRAFSKGTCTGCHTGDNQSTAKDTAFHISPFREGPSKLSTFFFDPTAKPGTDILSQRVSVATQTLCGKPEDQITNGR